MTKEQYKRAVEINDRNELVKLLFEKGYNKYPLSYDGDYWFCYIQMAMKWLREVNNRFIEICADRSHDFKNIIYRPSVYDKEDLVCLWESDNYKSYEEACEAAIKYCLENLI
jgi:hypothetical protein